MFSRIRAIFKQKIDAFLTEKTSLKAFLVSVALYLGLCSAAYVIGLLYMIASKWDPSLLKQPQIVIPSHIPLDQASLTRILSDPESSYRYLDQRLSQYQELLRLHQDVSYETSVHHESLQLALKEMTEPIRIPRLMRHNQSSVPIAQRTPRLTALLHALPNKLEEAFSTPSKLKQNIYMANRELMDLIKDDTTPWDHLAAWLASPYWRSIQWHTFDGSSYCPANTAEMDMDGSIMTSNSGLVVMAPDDQELVDGLVRNVRRLLDQRDKNEEDNAWQAALKETTGELENFYRDKVSIALNQLKYHAGKFKRNMKKKVSYDKSAISATPECPVTKEKVLAMVEAGLDAMYRKKDVRQAIGGSAMSGVQDDSYFILDAVIDEPWKPPREPYPESINLRHLMDKPLMKLVSRWVDDVLDLMGGYSDYIDSKIDSLADGREDVGMALADYLLTQSGKVNLPVPHKIQTKKLTQQKA